MTQLCAELVWALDHPKNQEGTAGSQTGAGVSARSSAPQGRDLLKTEPSVHGVLITNSLIIFSLSVVADSVGIVVCSHSGSIRIVWSNIPGQV